ncbi:hypothetical protein KA005_02920, partial [bacterium]|nr:hypothetical protein [bacterium]
MRFFISCIWFFAQAFLFQLFWKIIHIVNRINLYLSNVEVGKNLKTYGLISLDIHPKSRVKIGNNVQFVS